MRKLFFYFLKDRYKFLILSFLLLFIVEWFIFYQFTPFENYSYDYLIWIGYLVFYFLIILNAFRFNQTFFGRMQNYFKNLPISGFSILITNIVISCLEYIIYFTPLFYFISMSLAKIPTDLPLVQWIKRGNQYALQAFWHIFLLYILVSMIANFAVIMKKKDAYFFLVFLPLFFLLFCIRYWMLSVFRIPNIDNPASLFEYASFDLFYYGGLLAVFFVINVFALNKVFKYKNWFLGGFR